MDNISYTTLESDNAIECRKNKYQDIHKLSPIKEGAYVFPSFW